MSSIVAVPSDLHTNSTIGLCPPYIELDDGGAYKASKAQLWLWACWKEYIEKIEQAAELVKADNIVIVFNGDMFEGDHHGVFQIITKNPATMQRIAEDAIKPAVNLSDSIYIIRGTPAHVGPSAYREEEIAQKITNVVPERKEKASWDWLPLEADGVKMDIAHFRRGGNLPWTRNNIANRIAVETVLDYADHKADRPDLVVLAHKHGIIDSGRAHETRVLGSLSWQLPTFWVKSRIKAIPRNQEAGGFIFICGRDEPGKYQFDIERYPAPRKRRVKIR